MRAALAAVVFAGGIAGCGDDGPRATTHELSALGFTMAANTGLAADVAATVEGDAIVAVVPDTIATFGLVADFATDGARVDVGGVRQVSGKTPNDFRAPVAYVVTAEDGSTHEYTVRVWQQHQTAKAITLYVFEAVDNLGVLASDAPGVITGTAIAVSVPAGTPVTSLVAGYQYDGASITVGGVEQVEGATPHDFTQPVVYTLRAEDGSTADFTVTVTVGS